MVSLLSEDLGVVPILRETVQTRIHRQLRDLLMRGRFQPGQPLKIQEMADLFGTSTQPVREAIRQLVAEKALEALPNRTACVPILSLERLEDLYRVRIAIEGLTAELATDRVTEADLDRLESLIEGETHADDTDQAELSVAQNQSFHFELYRLSGSTVLPPIIEGLWLQIGPFIRKSVEYFDVRDGRGAESILRRSRPCGDAMPCGTNRSRGGHRPLPRCCPRGDVHRRRCGGGGSMAYGDKTGDLAPSSCTTSGRGRGARGCHDLLQQRGRRLLRAARRNASSACRQGFQLFACPPSCPCSRPSSAKPIPNDWMSTDSDVACPDPNCPSRFRITRLGKRRFQSRRVHRRAVPPRGERPDHRTHRTDDGIQHFANSQGRMASRCRPQRST